MAAKSREKDQQMARHLASRPETAARHTGICPICGKTVALVANYAHISAHARGV